MKKTPLWTKNFIFISLSNFFMFKSFYMLLPTLPIFVVEELQGSEEQVGLLIAFFTGAQIFSRPLAGKWLDDLGRRKVFLLSRALFLIAMIFYLGVTGIVILLIIRFLHGFGFGAASTAAGTIAADIIPESRRAEGLGYYSGFLSLAMVLGPFIGLWVMNSLGYVNMFIVCSLLAGASVLMGFLINFPESEKVKEPYKKRMSWKTLIEPQVIPVALVSICYMSVYGGIVSFIALYAQEIGILSAAAYFLGVFSVALMLIRPVAGKLADKIGTQFVIFPGMIISIIGLFLLSFSESILLFLISALFIGVGFGAIQPCLHALAISAVLPERRGAATATYLMSSDIGIATGAFVLGIVANYFGYSLMYLSAILYIMLGLILFFIYRIMKGKIAKTEKKNQINV